MPTGILERLLAAALLVVVLPTLALAGFFLRVNSQRPILVLDEIRTGGHPTAWSYRFRTTGRGTRAFQVFGRFLRAYGIDELPGLWSVVRGDIRLMPLFRQWQRTRN